MSILLFWLVLEQNIRVHTNDFRHDMDAQILSLDHKIEVLEQFWTDIQAFYASSDTVTREEFHSFSLSALEHQELLFIGRLPVGEEPSVSTDNIFSVSKTQQDGKTFMNILLRLPENSPAAANMAMIIDRTRQSKKIEAGALILPPPDGKEPALKQTVIIAAVPIFQKRRGDTPRELSSIILTILDARLLFNSVFQDRDKANISIYLDDRTEGHDARHLLFENHGNPDMLPEILQTLGASPPFSGVSQSLSLGSQFLEINADPSFSHIEKSSGWSSPWIALFLGMALTAFTALSFYQQINRNLAIQKIVDEKTSALQSSEKHIRAILDNTVDGIITIDEHGTIQTYNLACEKIFGYTSEETIGQQIHMLMPEPYRAHHHSYISNYLETGKAQIIGIGREVKGRRKNGCVFPMDLSIGEIKNKERHTFVGIVRDVSAQKEAQRTRELLALIVESSDDAIISNEMDGTITSWNPGAEHLYGYTAEEMMGQKISLIIPPDHQKEEDKIIARVKKGEQIKHFETVRIHKNGSKINISATVSPLRDETGRIIGASKVARDITARKKAEARLFRYTNQLKRSNQELDDFAYITSHDLKEPLRGLHNFSRFLLEDYQDKLDDEGKNMLNTIADLTRKMDALLSSLLHYSRLGRTEMSVRKTDLNQIAQDVIAMHEIRIRENGAQVKILRKLPEIVCDHVRIAEVFQNLIGNALKYNDSPDKIIEIGYRKDHPEHRHDIVYFIRDNGIGIDPKNLQAIFKIFRRLHPQDAYGGGTGSGLTIAERIIARHAGEIWAESQGKGKGTTFFFTIPQQENGPMEDVF